MRPRILVVALVAALAVGFAARLDAAADDRFALSSGPFQAAADTQVRVDVTGIGGTHLGLEDELGLDDDERLWYVKAKLRLTHRQRLLLDYYDLDRDATRLIDRDITFQGTVFPLRWTRWISQPKKKRARMAPRPPPVCVSYTRRASNGASALMWTTSPPLSTISTRR